MPACCTRSPTNQRAAKIYAGRALSRGSIDVSINLAAVIIAPLLPSKPSGVPRADDRKVLNGIFWRLRTGSPWADIPERSRGPMTEVSKRSTVLRSASISTTPKSSEQRGEELSVKDESGEAV
jgi:hypothetical protein